MFIRKLILSLLLPISSISFAASKIGITQIIAHPALDRNLKGIVETLEKNGIKKEDIEIQNAQGSPTLAAEIARRFTNDRELVIALGTPSAQAFLTYKLKKNFNVVFSSITDPLNAGLVKDLKVPDANMTGVSNNVAAQKQIQFIKKLLGKDKVTIAMLYNPGDANSLSAIQETEAIMNEEKVTLVKAPASKIPDMLSLTRKIVKEVDLIFIHNDNLALSALSSIVKIADLSKVPVFASDVDTMSLGVLGALGADQYELGRQTAEMALGILNGKKLSSLPVAYPQIIIQSVNVTQAKKLGLKIPEEILKNSVLYKEKEDA